jgi:hypothetical protein
METELNIQKQLVVVIILVVAVLIPTFTACSSVSGQDTHSPRITSLTAEHTTIYPLGNTRIDCVAVDPEGDNLNYTWASSDCKIMGNGQQITWEAPRSYGDFHIMVTVDDGKGNSANKVVTVTVIVRDPSTCCK